MATAAFRLSTSFPEARSEAATQSKAEPAKSLFARFIHAMMEARMRQAMRELALHPHLLPSEEVRPADQVPQDEVERAGYKATFADAGLLPFVR